MIIPRKHLLLTDMMAELERTLRPSVANYVFHNTYFFTEAKSDANISSEFTVARLRYRASISDKSIKCKLLFFFTARCTLVQSAVLRSHVC